MNARAPRPQPPWRSLLVLLALGLAHPLGADTIPRNLSGELRSLLALPAATRALAPAGGISVDYERLRVRDAEGRVLVKILLDGRQPLAAVRDRIAAIEGIRITASTDRYRAGVIEAFVPPSSLVAVANAVGVSSVVASNRPVTQVGAVTSQGIVQHRIDRLPAGIDGRGITVGVLSDSYDTDTSALTHAADDVASNDLPPDVAVLQDSPDGTDEGRAMMQIVHDIAPAARLGFATANGGEVNLADNIRSLAGLSGTPHAVPGFRADVIVDDVVYYAEPFFQDGIVAQAVDEVAEAGVSYFSSAGNSPGSQGYDSKLHLVPGTPASAAGTNIDLAAVPPELYAGGFHDFAPCGSPPDIAQTTSISGTGIIVFQWNEPFDPAPPALTTILAEGADTLSAPSPTKDFPFDGNAGEAVGITADADPSSPNPIPDVTITLLAPGGTVIGFQDATTNPELLVTRLPVTGTYTVRIGGYADATGDFVWRVQEAIIDQRVASDFNLLFFNSTGHFLFAFADDNLATNEPIELGAISVGNATFPLQLVIARSNTPDRRDHPANRIRYVWFGGGNPQEYIDYNGPTTYGHNCARGASGVAAYAFYPPYVPEAFTSPGPATIYFDTHDRRLRRPETRQKPDIAAMDGANTTFFYADVSQDPDDFPNFFGTSAAAPHAAGIAALMLQAAGGTGSLNPGTLRRYLQESTFMHDLDPNFASGWATWGRHSVYVTAFADGNSISQFDPNVFTVGYHGWGSLVDITLKPITGNTTETPTKGVIFDERVGPGQPFALGESSGIPESAFSPTFSDPADPPAVAGQWKELSIAIAGSAMRSGQYFRFGVDRDEADVFGPSGATGGNVADILGASVLIPQGTVAWGGAKFDATLASGLMLRGTLRNRLGWGYSVQDGFGFVNAEAAVHLAAASCHDRRHRRR
jgi:Subtilase family